MIPGAVTFRIGKSALARSSFLAVVLALTFSVVPGATPVRDGSAGVRLRYRFETGADYRLAVGLDLAMDTQVDGLPPEAAALAASGKNMKQHTTLTLRLQAAPRAADGSQALTVRVEDVQAKLSRESQVLRMQGLEERLENAVVLAGSLSSDGRTIELATPSQDDVPDAAREILALLLQMLPSFPDRALQTGESFQVPVRFTAPQMGGEDVALETRGTCVYTLRGVERGVARFDVHAEGTADSTADPTQRMSMKVENGGGAEFDLTQGIFTSLRSDLSIDLALDAELPSTDAVPPGTVLDFTPVTAPTKLHVHASAKGPLELAMTRTQPKGQ
jgi:hypothetical protein